MNTTDYFTNINALFLFCSFTCGLLVWAVIRGYIIKGKLTKEQDSHLKATLINTKLNKALEDEKKVSDNMEKLLRQVETEVRELQAKLDHAEADRIELRAERSTLENKLTDALTKVRKRDKDGKFLPSGNGRKKRVAVKAITKGVEDAVNMIKAAQPKLIHGLTVKNPTEDEAKIIFDEARRLGVEFDRQKHSVMYGEMHHIWFRERFDVSYRTDKVIDGSSECVVTAKEFVQRMQNGRG